MLKIFSTLWYFMLVGFVISDNRCDKTKEGCLALDVGSKSDSFEVAIQEIGKMMQLGICSSDIGSEQSLENFRVCLLKEVEYTTYDIEPDVLDLRNVSCFCDHKCHDYHDCCVDYAEKEDVLNARYLSCHPLPNTKVNIYSVQRCPSGWENDFTRTLCENEPLDLKKAGKQYSHLQYIPVHSKQTSVIYRNIYCAVCNSDTNLTKWKTHIHCSGHSNHTDWKKIDPEVDFSTNATYNPSKDNWLVGIGNDRKTCRVVVDEFNQSKKLLTQFDARLCKPAIDTCPPNTDENLSKKCLQYTSFVYEKKRFNGKLKAIYKNFHCALCHNVPVETITCNDPSSSILHTDHGSHDGKVWLPLLFDFNFGNEDDNQVGFPERACLLSHDQLWDPLLRSCLNLTCGKHFKRERGKCLPNENITNASHENDCQRLTLTKDMFVLLDNSSIYVNYSEKIYSPDMFESRINENGTIFQVLVCADERLLTDFSSIQAFLSEITLGISVTCLILHLFVYGILPKLRNTPGKILMSLSASLVCGHIFFLVGSHLRQVYWLCYLHGVATHFGYLSAFFWMSVMAFDIYGTFSISKTRSNNDNRTFKKYSVYAWISASLIVAAAIVVDTAVRSSPFRPKYGDGVCWINQKRALLLFFAVPVAGLLLSNILFFAVTAVSLRRISKQTKLVNNFSDKMRYFLYIKLAVVLGLTWIFGFMAALLNISALWYPFIILNGLQGALIFIVFTIKRKVLRMLVVKLRLRSHTYRVKEYGKGEKKMMYSSYSNLTTLQTSLTSSVVPAFAGNTEMLIAVRRIDSNPNIKQASRHDSQV